MALLEHLANARLARHDAGRAFKTDAVLLEERLRRRAGGGRGRREARPLGHALPGRNDGDQNLHRGRDPITLLKRAETPTRWQVNVLPTAALLVLPVPAVRVRRDMELHLHERP